MPSLVFKSTALRRVVEHAVKHHANVLLVHDDGVYLMSAGEPRDIESGSKSYVCYANKCNPTLDAEWWDNSRALVGGDDFGESLPWATQMLTAINAGAPNIRILVGPNRLELRTSPPSKTRAA
jgi:hypothetical protein